MNSTNDAVDSDCEHLFVFTNDSSQSSWRTHEISNCLVCKANYSQLCFDVLMKEQENFKETKEKDEKKLFETAIGHVCVWDTTTHCCGSLLNFQSRPDRTNYGFKQVAPRTFSEIKERRKCGKKCPMDKIEHLIK